MSAGACPGIFDHFEHGGTARAIVWAWKWAYQELRHLTFYHNEPQIQNPTQSLPMVFVGNFAHCSLSIWESIIPCDCSIDEALECCHLLIRNRPICNQYASGVGPHDPAFYVICPEPQSLDFQAPHGEVKLVWTPWAYLFSSSFVHCQAAPLILFLVPMAGHHGPPASWISLATGNPTKIWGTVTKASTKHGGTTFPVLSKDLEHSPPFLWSVVREPQSAAVFVFDGHWIIVLQALPTSWMHLNASECLSGRVPPMVQSQSMVRSRGENLSGGDLQQEVSRSRHVATDLAHFLPGTGTSRLRSVLGIRFLRVSMSFYVSWCLSWLIMFQYSSTGTAIQLMLMIYG